MQFVVSGEELTVCYTGNVVRVATNWSVLRERENVNGSEANARE